MGNDMGKHPALGKNAGVLWDSTSNFNRLVWVFNLGARNSIRRGQVLGNCDAACNASDPGKMPVQDMRPDSASGPRPGGDGLQPIATTSAPATVWAHAPPRVVQGVQHARPPRRSPRIARSGLSEASWSARRQNSRTACRPRPLPSSARKFPHRGDVAAASGTLSCRFVVTSSGRMSQAGTQ